MRSRSTSSPTGRGRPRRRSRIRRRDGSASAAKAVMPLNITEREYVGLAGARRLNGVLLSVRVLRGPVVRERFARARSERLDRVGQVLAVDVVVAALGADPVRLEQHLGMRGPVR